jgi:hypothetical protein
MANLMIKSGGNWYVPKGAYVKQGNNWLGAKAIYQKHGNDWTKHWPPIFNLNDNVVQYDLEDQQCSVYNDSWHNKYGAWSEATLMVQQWALDSGIAHITHIHMDTWSQSNVSHIINGNGIGGRQTTNLKGHFQKIDTNGRYRMGTHWRSDWTTRGPRALGYDGYSMETDEVWQTVPENHLLIGIKWGIFSSMENDGKSGYGYQMICAPVYDTVMGVNVTINRSGDTKTENIQTGSYIWNAGTSSADLWTNGGGSFTNVWIGWGFVISQETIGGQRYNVLCPNNNCGPAAKLHLGATSQYTQIIP